MRNRSIIRRRPIVEALELRTLLAGSTVEDTVVFGNTSSETLHSLVTGWGPVTPASYVTAGGGVTPSDPSSTAPSDVVNAALGQSGRRLLPRTPNADVYGGQVTFTMAVDPVKQNYFTAKFWGSDTASGEWFVLNVNGKEIGSRHGGGDGEMFQNADVDFYPNAFYYRTVGIPLNLTHGLTGVTITLRSLGWLSVYDSGAYFGHYNKLMSSPSPVVYDAYTSLNGYIDVSGEQQGTGPTLTTPRTIENDAGTVASLKTSDNAALTSKLSAAASTLSASDVLYLAESYNVGWTVGYQNPATVNQVIAGIDALVTAASNYAGGVQSYMGAQGNPSWGGYFGPVGNAIRLIWPQLQSQMSASVSYGGVLGTASRTSAWGTALRASIDSGRFNRQTISNQAMTNGDNIYNANRGLELVNPSLALNESEALRYLYESTGLSPWLGNDQTGGTNQVPLRGTAPYGPNWYMITSNGTSKEDGFVGSDYGELGPWIYRLGLEANDSQIEAQGIKTTRSRINFRFPGFDSSGYLVMQGAEPIGVRNDGLPGHYVYLGRSTEDDFIMASQGAGIIGSDLLGYFQEEINDGQLSQVIAGNNSLYLPDAYAAVIAMAQTNIKLPEAPGQPDFAWGDAQNMVVAARHGNDEFFANLDWREPTNMNGIAKVLDLTPQTARIAEVQEDDVRFNPTGGFNTDSGSVEQFSYDTPPDNPDNALDGIAFPTALRSDLSTIPSTNRDSGRGTGYTMRYGNWLVAIDADYANTYSVTLPGGLSSATDLVTGRTLSGSTITLAPQTVMVVYLPDATPLSTAPARPITVDAAAAGGRVNVVWNYSSGATSYTVRRATTRGGPYTSVATGVSDNTFIDTSVTNGTTYYYVVDAVNASGTSGDSPETSATPAASQTSGLPAPFSDLDINTGKAGSTAYSGGAFTIVGGGSDIWNTADGFHFVYEPLFGNGSITAKVVSQSSTNSFAKAGVQIRDNVAANAVRVNLALEPIGRAEMNTRGSVGGSASVNATVSSISAPYWVRLTRTGPLITGFVSPDGITWTTVSTTTLASLSPLAYVGLAATATNNGQTNTVVYNNVSVTNGTAIATAPTGLTAAATSSSAVNLNWTASAGATGYNVKRSTVSGGPFSTLALDSPLNTFTDNSITAGTTYYYVVTAVNDVGISGDSNQANVTSPTPTAAPTNLNASAAGLNTVNLSWTAVGGATSYNVKRSSASGGPYTTIASGISTTTFTDANAPTGSTTFYIVTATNSAGAESSASSESSALTYSVSTTKLTGTYLGTSGSWNNQGNTGSKAFDGDLATFFDSQNSSGTWVGLDLGSAKTIAQISFAPRSTLASRMTGGAFQASTTADFSSNVVTLYTVPAAPSDGILTTVPVYGASAYRYVRYLSPDNGHCNVAEVQFFTAVPTTIAAPLAPSNLIATAVQSSRINLTWTDNATNETGYQIDRATNPAFTQNLVTDLVRASSSTYSAVGLTPGDAFYFRVRAVNAVGNSAYTVTSNGTTPTVSSVGLFTAADVGAPLVSGYSSYAPGTYTVVGSGADIGGSSDQFQFASTTAAANTQLDARATWLSNTSSSAKSGLMYRDSSAANAAYAFLWISPTNQLTFETRASNGASVSYSASTSATPGPVFLRLVRGANNTFTALYLPVFGTWTQLGTTQTVTMAASALVGLAATSHSAAALTTSVFDSVSLTSHPYWLSPTSLALWNPVTHALTVTGPSAIVDDPGTDMPIVSASGTNAVLTLSSPSNLQIHLGGLSLRSGASAKVLSLGAARSLNNYRLLAIGASTATAAPLYVVDSTSSLDLADNDMAILYGSGASPFVAVQTELTAAYDAGLWDTPGLSTSTAATQQPFALGWGESSALNLTSFDGQSLGSNAVLVKYTRRGDVDLNGTVDLADYTRVITNFGAVAATWSMGSFGYDGTVGLSDYTLVVTGLGTADYGN